MQNQRQTGLPAQNSIWSADPAIRKALRFASAICGRTSIVADNSNLFWGGRDRDWRIDWGHPLQSALGGDKLLAAHFVVSMPPQIRDEERRGQLAFYDLLGRVGWRVYRHRLLHDEGGAHLENEKLVDGDVKTLTRKSADDPRCCSIVLMTGDGGMTDAVKHARRAGKCVFVVAWQGTLHPALADAANDYAFIDELRPLIARVAI